MFKVHLQGRMGNQLFQYAFAYVTAKKNKTTFFLEMDRNKFYLKSFKLNFPYSLLNSNLLLFMLIEWIGREQQFAIEKIGLTWKRPWRLLFYYAIILTIIWFSGKEQQFIYFQF
jgi:hypothetical protein